MTEGIKYQFIEYLLAGDSVKHAANKVKLSREALYKWRRRDDSFSKEWDQAIKVGVHMRKETFLEALVETGNVRLAAQNASISIRTAHYWRQKDLDFAREWKCLSQHMKEDRLREAMILAMELGNVTEKIVEKPVICDGVEKMTPVLKTTITKPNFKAYLAYLKRFHPEFQH